MRNFDEWMAKFRATIADYGYYTDFKKVFANVDSVKVELNILNSLIGSTDIERQFEDIVRRYPETLKCVPILLAKREIQISATDAYGSFVYCFDKMNYTIEQYKYFMRKTGLFELLEKRIVGSLMDYVTGVEVGLDSNGRKNRGGHLMENVVEGYLQKAGLNRDETYFREMYISEVEEKWGIDLSNLSNRGSTEKRFDFVFVAKGIVYGVETNFYASGGSKLNETARSYKTIALEVKDMPNFKFIWFTDGAGWRFAKNNLRETFDVLEDLYSIDDLESGIIAKIVNG